MQLHEIDDHYVTCTGTYATLRITSERVGPDAISALIGCGPTRSFEKGEQRTKRTDVNDRYYPWHGWFFSTKGLSESRDCRRHLEILLAGPLKDTGMLEDLRDRGCEMSVAIMYCYTQGGPTISPDQMRGLAAAGVEVWWDLYREPGIQGDESGRC